MLFLMWEKLLHWFHNILKVLKVMLFYMGNYCIRAKKLYLILYFLAYLIDEIVTRKKYMTWFEFKVGHI